jgi:hypothetical protein
MTIKQICQHKPLEEMLISIYPVGAYHDMPLRQPNINDVSPNDFVGWAPAYLCKPHRQSWFMANFTQGGQEPTLRELTLLYLIQFYETA